MGRADAAIPASPAIRIVAGPVNVRITVTNHPTKYRDQKHIQQDNSHRFGIGFLIALTHPLLILLELLSSKVLNFSFFKEKLTSFVKNSFDFVFKKQNAYCDCCKFAPLTVCFSGPT